MTGGFDERQFEALLAALDPDRDLAGERYELLRTRLIKHFSWEGAAEAEDLADEALTRLARRLADGEPVLNIASYLGGVARMIALESQRKRRRREDGLPEVSVPAVFPKDEDRASSCLARCLGELPKEARSLIVRYYEGDEGARTRNRHRLAMELGLNMNSLRNRALRLREKIERCMKSCLDQDGSTPPITRN